MRIAKFLLAGALLTLLGFAACLRAADAPVGNSARPASAAPATTAPAPPGIEDVILPPEVFTPGSLERVLNQIHDLNPGFNAIVVRDAGVKEGFPVLPEMRLKNVSIGQFIQFIVSTYPSVNMQALQSAGNSPVLYTFHIVYTAENSAGTSPQQVVIYRLADMVNAAGGNAKALDDILSLIKNALDSSPDQTPALLKIHPETQTLIFRGTNEQREIVNQVVQAMTQNAHSEETMRYSEAARINEILKAQLQQMSAELARTREMLKSQSPATRP